jgi:uncharacterized protein YciI
VVETPQRLETNLLEVRTTSSKETSKGTRMNEDHRQFLNELRDSGIVNMFGSMTYVRDQFGLSKAEATAIVLEWMKTFRKQNESN